MISSYFATVLVMQVTAAYERFLFTSDLRFDFWFNFSVWTHSQNESNDAAASAVEGLCCFMPERPWCVTWEGTQVLQRLAWEVGGTLAE